MRRVMPAIGLFFLSPFVGEFLLGDFALNALGLLLVLAPMYGGGALLIRELVRRNHRGWPSIFVLALAYAILEEAFFDQTLFNPHYLGLHLLDSAYIAPLGIGGWWTVFVLTLHVVWSVSVSIALVEALVPDRAGAPWLKWPGMVIVVVLFALGASAVTLSSIQRDPRHFVASVPQFASAAVICLLLIVAAFRLPLVGKPQPREGQAPASPQSRAPTPFIAGVYSFCGASLFLLVPPAWGWWAVAAYLVLDLISVAAILHWSLHPDWDLRHKLALASGAVLTYAWHAFLQAPVIPASPLVILLTHVVFGLAIVGLILIAWRRTSNFLETEDLHRGVGRVQPGPR